MATHSELQKFPMPRDLHIPGLTTLDHAQLFILRECFIQLDNHDRKHFGTFYKRTWDRLLSDLKNKQFTDNADLFGCLDDAWNCNYISRINLDAVTDYLTKIANYFEDLELQEDCTES
jgi:hypothetical protein